MERLQIKAMHDDQEFKINQRVKVVGHGSNASDFNVGEIPIMGVYSFTDWQNRTFRIGGFYSPITFKHSLEVYGAYPLIYRNKIVGFVYNTGLRAV